MVTFDKEIHEQGYIIHWPVINENDLDFFSTRQQAINYAKEVRSTIDGVVEFFEVVQVFRLK